MIPIETGRKYLKRAAHSASLWFRRDVDLARRIVKGKADEGELDEFRRYEVEGLRMSVLYSCLSTKQIIHNTYAEKLSAEAKRLERLEGDDLAKALKLAAERNLIFWTTPPL